MNFSQEFQEYLEEKYSDNHWWLSHDAKFVAGYQLYEERLAVPFSLFHKGTEKLLGRSVWTHEFANTDALQKEFEKRNGQ